VSSKEQNLKDLRNLIVQNDYDRVKELLNRRVSSVIWGSLDENDLNTQYSDGKSPLYLAIDKVDLTVGSRIIELLIKKGADINLGIYEKLLEKGQYAKAKYITTLKGFKIPENNQEILNQCLHEKIKDNIDLQDIIALGADINSLNSDGKSIFIKAIESNKLREAKDIAEIEGFKLSEADKNALHEALYQSNWALDRLLGLGADINAQDKNGKTVFSRCIENNKFYDAKKIKNKAGFELSETDKNALNEALNGIDWSSWKASATMDELVSFGADINAQDKNGKTVIMKAIESRCDIDNIDKLIELGADVNIPDASGRYPLDVAVDSGYKNAAKKLYDLEAKGDYGDKLQDLLGLSFAGKIINNEERPYIKYLDTDVSIQDLSNERVIKLYKETRLKSLYFKTNDLQFNDEFTKFIEDATDSGLKEIIIFCDKNSSNLDSDKFNQFLLDNKVRINLRIAPVTEEDLEIIKRDEFAKRDILAIKDTRNYRFTYRNGHAISLLNDERSDEIILENYQTHRKEIIEGATEAYVPKYKYEEDKSTNKNIYNVADFEMSINREQEFSAEQELSAEQEVSSEAQLSIDNEQRDKKFDSKKAADRLMDIHKNYFYDSYITDGSPPALYSYIASGVIYNIFSSSDQIKYISEKALRIICSKVQYFKNGINVNNMPIGFALTDGIIFASNERLASMEVNDFTLKPDSIFPVIEQPLQYSWLKYASLDSLTGNLLYGSEVCPLLRGEAEHPEYGLRNQNIGIPYYTSQVAYEVDEIRQQPIRLSKLHPAITLSTDDQKNQYYESLAYSIDLTKKDKNYIDYIYNEFNIRGFFDNDYNGGGLTRLIETAKISDRDYGDFLLQERSVLFFKKLFNEMFPLDDKKKIYFVAGIMTPIKEYSYNPDDFSFDLENRFNSLNGLYNKINEFLIKQGIPPEHHQFVLDQVVKIAKESVKDPSVSIKLDRLITSLNECFVNGGNLYEQLYYMEKNPEILNSPVLNAETIRKHKLNVVHTPNIKMLTKEEILKDVNDNKLSSYLSAIPPHLRPRIDIVSFLGNSLSAEYTLGRRLSGSNEERDIISQGLDLRVNKESDRISFMNNKIKKFYDTHREERNYVNALAITSKNINLASKYTSEQTKNNNALFALNVFSSTGNNYDSKYPDGEFEHFISLFDIMFKEVKVDPVVIEELRESSGVTKNYDKDIYYVLDSFEPVITPEAVKKKIDDHKQMVNKFIEIYKNNPSLTFHQVVAFGLVSNFVNSGEATLKNAKELYVYKEHLALALRTMLATKVTDNPDDFLELKARSEKIASMINFLSENHRFITNKGKNKENIALFTCFFAGENNLPDREKLQEFVNNISKLDSGKKIKILARFSLNKLPFGKGKIIDSNFPQLNYADITDVQKLDEIANDESSQVNYDDLRQFNDISLDSRESAPINLENLRKKYPLNIADASYKELKANILKNPNYIVSNISLDNADKQFIQQLSKDLVHEMLQAISQETNLERKIEVLFNENKSLHEQILEFENNKRLLEKILEKHTRYTTPADFLNKLMEIGIIASTNNNLGKLLDLLNNMNHHALADKVYRLVDLLEAAGNDVIIKDFNSFKMATEFFLKDWEEDSIEFPKLMDLVKKVSDKNYSQENIEKIFNYCAKNRQFNAMELFSSISGGTNNINKIVEQITSLEPQEINMLSSKIGFKKLVKLSPLSKLIDMTKIVVKYQDIISQDDYDILYNKVRYSKNNEASRSIFSNLLLPNNDILTKERAAEVVFNNINNAKELDQEFEKYTVRRFEYNKERLHYILNGMEDLNSANYQGVSENKKTLTLSAFERFYHHANEYIRYDMAELEAESKKLQENRNIIAENSKEELLENDIKFIALSAEIMYQKMGMVPKDTQILSVLNSVLIQGNLNMQIATGEGKTVTAAMIAAYLAYSQKGTTIITSANRQLAARDLKITKSFYEALGLELGQNIIKSDMDLREFSSGRIYYSTASDFALSVAQLKFDKVHGCEEFLTSLNMVGDEIDAALTSVIRYVLAVQTLDLKNSESKSLFSFIVDYVESDFISQHNLSTESHVHNLNELIQVKFSKYKEYLRFPLNEIQKDNLMRNNNAEAKALLEFNNAIAKISENDRNYYLEKLLNAALFAKSLKKNIDYVIPASQGENQSLNIQPIIDNAARKGVIFGNGVQGFIHLLEERSNPSLQGKFAYYLPSSTLFDLNVKNLYDYIKLSSGRVVGISGTLKDRALIDEFKKNLNIRSISIPVYAESNKKIQFDEVDNQEKQYTKMLDSVNKSDPKQPILIFVENSIEAKTLEEKLKLQYPKRIIQLADASTDSESLKKIVKDTGNEGYITVATPVVGRGEDFSTEYKAGFKSIILATEGINEANLWQMIGRTGRNGAPADIECYFDKEKYPGFSNHEEYRQYLSEKDTVERDKMLAPGSAKLYFSDNTAGNQMAAIKALEFIKDTWNRLQRENNNQPIEELKNLLYEQILTDYPNNKKDLFEFLEKIESPEPATKLRLNLSAVEQNFNDNNVINTNNYPKDWKGINTKARRINIRQVALPKERDPIEYKLFYDVFHDIQLKILASHFFEINKDFDIEANYKAEGKIQNEKQELVSSYKISGEGSGGNLMITELKDSYHAFLENNPNSLLLSKIDKIINNIENINDIDLDKLELGKYQAFTISVKVDSDSGHEISFLTDGRYLFQINRGYGAEIYGDADEQNTSGIKIYKVFSNLEELKETLKKLQGSVLEEFKAMPKKNQQQVTKSETEKLLYPLLKTDSQQLAPEHVLIKMPVQTVGNCGWAQVESLLKAIVVAGKLDTTKELPKFDSFEVQDAIKDSNLIYNSFSLFDKLQRMEEILFTIDQNFQTNYLSAENKEEINSRREHLVNPVDLDLINEVTKKLTESMDSFKGSIYEARSLKLLHAMKVEQLLLSEKEIAVPDFKKILSDLPLEIINELQDLQDIADKVFENKDMRKSFLQELMLYVGNNPQDDEIFAILKEDLHPNNITHKDRELIYKTLINSVKNDQPELVKILINTLGADSFSQEEIASVFIEARNFDVTEDTIKELKNLYQNLDMNKNDATYGGSSFIPGANAQITENIRDIAKGLIDNSMQENKNLPINNNSNHIELFLSAPKINYPAESANTANNKTYYNVISEVYGSFENYNVPLSSNLDLLKLSAYAINKVVSNVSYSMIDLFGENASNQDAEKAINASRNQYASLMEKINSHYKKIVKNYEQKISAHNERPDDKLREEIYQLEKLKEQAEKIKTDLTLSYKESMQFEKNINDKTAIKQHYVDELNKRVEHIVQTSEQFIVVFETDFKKERISNKSIDISGYSADEKMWNEALDSMKSRHVDNSKNHNKKRVPLK
jgi:hypothetical protein